MADYGYLISALVSPTANDATYTHTHRLPVIPRIGTLSSTLNLERQPSFQEYLQAIKDIDGEISLPGWNNCIASERALEQTRLLRYYGGYQDWRWNLATGIPNFQLDYVVRKKYPNYPGYFSKNGPFDKLTIPRVGVPFDASHFHATLNKYLDWPQNRKYIRPDLAGWAGDMFTFAKNLDSLHKKIGFSNDSLYKLASLSIGEKLEHFKHSFGPSDFYADIDARNISTLVRQGLPLHTAIDGYFNNDLYGRFGFFINSYGGWKNFEKKVRSYNFFPNDPLIDSIFIDAAQKAFINKVREGCMHEMDCF